MDALDASEHGLEWVTKSSQGRSGQRCKDTQRTQQTVKWLFVSIGKRY